MGIGANSYASVAEIAAQVGRYTNDGSFDASTRPTLTNVELMIDRVSGILNVVLARFGFSIPVSQADCKLMLDQFTVDHVVHLCHAANGAGPYGPGNEQLRGQDAFSVIMREAAKFIGENAAGLELLGVTRTYSMSYGLNARLTDESGDDIVPPFQWQQVGHQVQDWDIDDE